MRRIYEFDSIGTHWWCEILDETGQFDQTLIDNIDATCQQFDREYSRFRDDSLVSELARTGKLTNPPTEMLAMFDFAREMYEVSGGAFDISVGALLHKYGYGSRMHGGDGIPDFWQKISYDAHKVSIPKGLMLDFGGLGKGWLIDKLSQVMRDHGVMQFIVNGGGDLYVQSDQPIKFALQDPYDSSQSVGETQIASGALAASSTLKRTWEHDGAKYHHIFDPATQNSSAGPVVATFVRADSALVADTMATILILRPELNDALTKRYGLQVMLIKQA